jgi:iron complex outermembrane receptor protein
MLVLPTSTFAQAPKANESTAELEEIVVTGTLIRGTTEPVGTNVITTNQEAIAATGVTTTAQLLQTIPQLGSFNNLQIPSAIGTGVNRPNLRELPGFESSGGSTTLVLLDGHRMVGMGLTTTSPDPDFIPPGAIERLEIVPDGGSAIYGSDAVAGVMNFVTRKKFDGLKVDGHFGKADSYHQADGNFTAGTDWGSGGVYASYSYAEHTALFVRDRDYARTPLDGRGLRPLDCSPGTVQTGGPSGPLYGLPYVSGAAVAGTPNQCDPGRDGSFYPEERRHSLLASFTQDIGETMKFDVQAVYLNRRQDSDGGPYKLQGGSTVTSTNPLYRPVNGSTPGPDEQVFYSFGGPNSTPSHFSVTALEVTPQFTAYFGESWQVRVLGSYGESKTESRGATFNPQTLTNAVNAGLFNPYDPALSDPVAYNAVTNYEGYGVGRQRLENVRAIADGNLFTLPGGWVKVAAGAEYVGEGWRSQNGAQVPGTQDTGYAGLSIGSTLIAPPAPALSRFDLSRNVKSVFGEVVVPVFGAPNAMAGLQELSLSAAGRYDKYSDVGSTTNPKFGFTYKPTNWLKFRGAWGKSFNAPSLADAAGADVTTLFGLSPFLAQILQLYPTGSNLQNYPAPLPGQYLFAVRGNSDNIQPQKAETTSFGFEVKPVEALNIGVTYWKIRVAGLIAVPPGNSFQQLYSQYPQIVTVAPTSAQLNALAAAAAKTNSFGPFGRCDNLPAPNCTSNAYAVFDLRKQNLSSLVIDGLDYILSYNHEVGFGTLMFGVNATYVLNEDQKPSPSLPEIDLLAHDQSRFKMRTTVGAQIGGLFSQLAWNHTRGYFIDPPIGYVPQTELANFNVFNLAFRYDFKQEGWLKDLSLSLNVDNVFDTDPPEYRGIKSGGAPGVQFGTIGRMAQVGFSKKFF